MRSIVFLLLVYVWLMDLELCAVLLCFQEKIITQVGSFCNPESSLCFRFQAFPLATLCLVGFALRIVFGLGTGKIKLGLSID